MKRYRVLSYSFDSRAITLKEQIDDSWEETIKEQCIANKERIYQGIIYEFGQFSSDKKIINFAELGAMPFSILAFHNRFLAASRNAFIMGAYYPALTGACALGERILNHLILSLRNDYMKTPEYKQVYRKDSFDKWSLAIDTLHAWEVLLDDVATDYKELALLDSLSPRN